ncbi:hypothetical protein GFS03_12215 [Sulfolobus sp. E5-1-F]|uniref:hypothetical protein n=1 Tax=Saccharolobus sp. E5-1-F TaxID=2663019 RepID=UPI001294E294|nr:hypothetical protein GFS03_12215 [Sulfolobus sp. E5-1-F]
MNVRIALRILTIVLITLILSESLSGVLVTSGSVKNVFMSLVVLDGKPIIAIQTYEGDFLNITLEGVNGNRITLPLISLNTSNVQAYVYDKYLVIGIQERGSLTVYVIDSSLASINHIKLNYNYSVQYPLLTGSYLVLISKKLVGVISRNVAINYSLLINYIVFNLNNSSLFKENIPIYNISIFAINFINNYEKNISITDAIGFPLNFTPTENNTIGDPFFPLNGVLPIFSYENWIYIVNPVYSNSTIEGYEVETVNLNTGSVSSTAIKFKGYMSECIPSNPDGLQFLVFYNESNISVYSINGSYIESLEINNFTKQLERPYAIYEPSLPPVFFGPLNGLLFVYPILEIGPTINIISISIATVPSLTIHISDYYLIARSYLDTNLVLFNTTYGLNIYNMSNFYIYNKSILLISFYNSSLSYYEIGKTFLNRLPPNTIISTGLVVENNSVQYYHNSSFLSQNFPLIQGSPIILRYNNGTYELVVGLPNSTIYIPREYFVVGVYNNTIVLYHKGKFYLSPGDKLHELNFSIQRDSNNFTNYIIVCVIVLLVSIGIYVIIREKDRIS